MKYFSLLISFFMLSLNVLGADRIVDDDSHMFNFSRSDDVQSLLTDPSALLSLSVPSPGQGDERLAKNLNSANVEVMERLHAPAHMNRDLRQKIEDAVIEAFNKKFPVEERANAIIALTLLNAYEVPEKSTVADLPQRISLETYVMLTRLIDSGYRKIFLQLMPHGPTTTAVASLELALLENFDALFNLKALSLRSLHARALVFERKFKHFSDEQRSLCPFKPDWANTKDFIAVAVDKCDAARIPNQFAVAVAEYRNAKQTKENLPTIMPGHNVYISYDDNHEIAVGVASKN